jgi:hypothetical protein
MMLREIEFWVRLLISMLDRSLFDRAFYQIG